MNNKNCQYYDEVERALENKLNEPLFLFPVDSSTKRLDTIKTRPISRLLFKNNKSGPDETCPKKGIIYAPKTPTFYLSLINLLHFVHRWYLV